MNSNTISTYYNGMFRETPVPDPPNYFKSCSSNLYFKIEKAITYFKVK